MLLRLLGIWRSDRLWSRYHVEFIGRLIYLIVLVASIFLESLSLLRKCCFNIINVFLVIFLYLIFMDFFVLLDAP